MDGYRKRLRCGSCGSDSFETILEDFSPEKRNKTLH